MPVKSKALKNFFGFKQQLHSVGDKQWACMILNDPNDQYGFKGDSFKIDFKTATGYVSEDNQHWLLGTVAETTFNSDGVCDFEAKKQGDKINEKTGKAQWIDDTETNNKLRTDWVNSGCLLAIKCDNMPSVKILASILHSKKVIAKNEVTIHLREHSTEQLTNIEQDLNKSIDYLLLKGQPSISDPEYQTMLVISQLGMLVVPIKSESELPRFEIKDIFGNVQDTKIISIPYTGNLPYYDSVSFTAPVEVQRKAYTAQGSINAVYTPEERLTWICDTLKASDVPIESNNIASIHKAINSNQKYDDYYRIALQLSGVPIPLDNIAKVLNSVSNTNNNSNGNGNNTVTLPSATTVANDIVHTTHIPPFDEEDAKFNIAVTKYKNLLVSSGLKEDVKTTAKRSIKEIEYLTTILSSNTYKSQRAEMVVWIIKNIGTNTDLLTLKDTELGVLATAVEHNDNMLSTNPKQNISTLVL